LPTDVVDINKLIAHSCIVRSFRQGSFIVTGAGGLPNLPDDLATAPFVTNGMALDALTPPVKEPPGSGARAKRFDAAPAAVDADLVEVDGIYQLKNGTIVLGRSCHGF